ncbi:MAG: HEAT repeat domain-containing protein [Planctomycetota bacterium]
MKIVLRIIVAGALFLPAMSISAEDNPPGIVPDAIVKQGYYDFAYSGDPINFIEFSPDGKLIITTTAGTIRQASTTTQWNVITGEKTGPLTEKKEIADLALIKRSPNGQRIAGLIREAKTTRVTLLDAESFKRVKTFGTDISRFAFSPKGNTLATLKYERKTKISQIEFWNMETGEVTERIQYEGEIRELAYSPDGKILAGCRGDERPSWSDDPTSGFEWQVILWDVETHKKIREVGTPGQKVNRIEFTPDGHYLIATADTHILWDAGTWTRTRKFPFGLWSVIAPGGKTLAIGNGIWDVETGKRIAYFNLPEGQFVRCKAFSPDGRYIAIATNGFVRLWQASRIPSKLVPPSGPPVKPDDKSRKTGNPKLDDIVARYDKVSFGIWNSLVHAATNKKDAQEALDVDESLRHLADGDSAGIDKAGGLEAIQKKLMGLLKSRDPVVKTAAVVLLGVIGDKSSAPELARLMEKKGQTSDETEEISASAIVALGLMQATEYAPRIAKFLKSDQEKFRSAAIIALGLLQAKDQAEDIAQLLEDKRPEVQLAAANALAELGAKQYAPQVAKRLTEDTSDKKAWLYALSRFGNMEEYAKDIALLLKDRFVAEYAAIALALMNAKGYAPQIAEYLKNGKGDRYGFATGDALFALGWLRALEFEKDVSVLLDSDNSHVVKHAAISLILMESPTYAARAIEILDEWFDGRIWNYDFLYLPKTEVDRVLKRAWESYSKLRGE